MNKKPPLTWDDIDAAMHTFCPTSGGFSLAKRGIITLFDGTTVFVKLALDDETKVFIAKELKAYAWLKQKKYPYIPEVLLTKENGLVLPDLSSFDWENTWTTDKLDAVFNAIDKLSELPLTKEDKAQLPDTVILNGWQSLLENPKYYKKLLSKLSEHPKWKTSIQNNLQRFAESTQEYLDDADEFKLIHADIRADNLAYNPAAHNVYIIDWNWMGMGRKGIEDLALLSNIAHSDFDVEKHYHDRLDPTAALVLAGFWFYHSTRRIWEGGNPALRDFQFKNALQVSKWAHLI